MSNVLIPINFDGEQPTVSARDLHTGLEIRTAFKDWFPRMTEYGFEAGKDFCSKMSESTGGRPATDYEISVDMAKQICMIQRSEKGRQYRQYFIDLEKAWNTPEQVLARALKIADKEIEKLKSSNTALFEDVQRMKPKETFADVVAASHTSILIGELAKILKQNGVETGQRRLFTWMRDNGYLIKTGSSRNMPTQKSMELVIFYHNGTFTHTGLVTAVIGDRFYTIEGNTSGASGIIANGGGVCAKSYLNSQMPGTKFCTPDYSIVSDIAVPSKSENTSSNTTQTGEKYMFEPKTVKAGDKNTSVLLLQEILKSRGFKGKNKKELDLDREAGDNTIYALKQYQKSRGLDADGVCGSVTWKDLIAI